MVNMSFLDLVSIRESPEAITYVEFVLQCINNLLNTTQSLN